MKYQQAVARLQANNYRVVSGIEVSSNNERTPLWLEVEVSPFAVYSNVEKIKMLLPEMEVRKENCNGGVGRITIKSRP